MNPKIILITFLAFLISNLSAQDILLQLKILKMVVFLKISQTTNATDGGWLVGLILTYKVDFPIGYTQMLILMMMHVIATKVLII